MNEIKFTQVMDDVYAAFGKKLPEERILLAAFKRVSNLPDEFLDYAQKRLEDMEKLPSNLGLFLARDLWPDFRADNPERFIASATGCPDCSGGLRVIYDSHGLQYATACGCCADRNLIVACGQYDDYEIAKRGLLTSPPKMEGERYGDKWRAKGIVKSALAGAREGPRIVDDDWLNEFNG